MNQFIVAIFITILVTVYADKEVQQQSIDPIPDETWWAEFTNCQLVYGGNMSESNSNADHDRISCDDSDKAVDKHNHIESRKPFMCRYSSFTVDTSNIATMWILSDHTVQEKHSKQYTSNMWQVIQKKMGFGKTRYEG
jgi:hypothetical protein